MEQYRDQSWEASVAIKVNNYMNPDVIDQGFLQEMVINSSQRPWGARVTNFLLLAGGGEAKGDRSCDPGGSSVGLPCNLQGAVCLLQEKSSNPK